MIRGVAHIHTTFSDGEFTLSELSTILQAAGYGFACVTDHAEYFDANRVVEYERACAAASSSSFLMIPGLEYRCDHDIHVLGIGVTAQTALTDASAVIRHIANHSGFSVIAHPRHADVDRWSALNVDAIEVWNSKRDGQHAPNSICVAALSAMRAGSRRPTAFYGLDLHFRTQYRGLHNELGCSVLSREAILDAYRAGNYFGVKGDVRLAATGAIPSHINAKLLRAERRSRLVRKMLLQGKNWLGEVRIPVPAIVKRQLRRVI